MFLNVQALRKRVFFPTFSIFLGFVLLFFFKKSLAISKMEQTQTWILDHFNRGFSLLAFLTLMTCILIYLSPIRHVRIGGPKAKPLLNKWNWFTISLCTTIAVGILFWAPAEPLYHYHTPPKGLPFEGTSQDSEWFAIATMYLHWSFTPYSIYMVPTLILALMTYNFQRPSNLGSAFEPIIGRRLGQKWSFVFDGMSLFALGVSPLAQGLAFDRCLGLTFRDHSLRNDQDLCLHCHCAGLCDLCNKWSYEGNSLTIRSQYQSSFVDRCLYFSLRPYPSHSEFGVAEPSLLWSSFF